MFQSAQRWRAEAPFRASPGDAAAMLKREGALEGAESAVRAGAERGDGARSSAPRERRVQQRK